MDPTALAALLAQLIPLGIQVYNEIAQANANVPSLTTVLAQADVNWDEIAATAQAQLGPGAPEPSVPKPVDPIPQDTGN